MAPRKTAPPTPDRQTPAGMKWCSLCGHTKKLDEFDRHAAKRSGRQIWVPSTWCSLCKQARRRTQRQGEVA